MSRRGLRGPVAVERLAMAPALGDLRSSRVWEAMVLLAALAAFSIALAPALKETGASSSIRSG